MKTIASLIVRTTWTLAWLAATQSLPAVVFEELYSFPVEPANPAAVLAQGPDGALYGTTAYGGRNDAGTVFRLTTNGTLTKLFSFTGTNGANPFAGLTLGSDGAFYGSTCNGGENDLGTVFRITPNGALAMLASFSGTNGANPYGDLVQGNDGSFYGTTAYGGNVRTNLGGIGHGGGVTSLGTVFRMTTNGSITPLVLFDGTNGANPKAGLALGPDGDLYGTTSSGGSNACGTVFRMTTNGALTPLVSFAGTNGYSPIAGLVLGNDDNFYGTASFGGTWGAGTVFRVTTNGTLTTLTYFDGTNAAIPFGMLALGSDGNFYGTTAQSQAISGGPPPDRPPCSGRFFGTGGTVFRVTPDGLLTILISFTSTNNVNPDGLNPQAGLLRAQDGAFYGTTAYGGSSSGAYTDVRAGTVFRMTIGGTFSTFTLETLRSFAGLNAVNPGNLTEGPDGTFYGTTARGGGKGQGMVFRVAANGMLTTLCTFQGSDGASPSPDMIFGPDGSLYGTTSSGGSNGVGTVFRLTTNGTLTTLVMFNNANGAYPSAGLTLGADEAFYGTTSGGGDNSAGTVFRVTTNGAFTTLASFDGTNASAPNGPMLMGSNGVLYGPSLGDWFGGGTGDWGEIFRIAPGGTLTPLLRFTGTNGAFPVGNLVQGDDGALYGTTAGVFAWEVCGIGFSIGGGNGTVFRLATNGVTTLAEFRGANAAVTHAGLVRGADGAFYGTTAFGGSSGQGSVFRVATNGVFTTLFSFTGANGANPTAGLTLGSDGAFYGTTSTNGSGGAGAIFRLSAWSFFSSPVITNGDYVVQITGQPGITYTLESAIAINGQWQKMVNITAPNTNLGHGIGVVEFSEPVGAAPQRFYRTAFPAY